MSEGSGASFAGWSLGAVFPPTSASTCIPGLGVELQLKPVFQKDLHHGLPLLRLDFAIGGIGVRDRVETVGIEPVGAALPLNPPRRARGAR